jgi:Protein of unknown function DUF131
VAVQARVEADRQNEQSAEVRHGTGGVVSLGPIPIPETRWRSLRIGRPSGAVWLICSGRDRFSAWLMISRLGTRVC